MVLNGVDPSFAFKVTLLLRSCESKGVDFLLTEGLRDPYKQANLWKNGRSDIDIAEKIEFLRIQNASFIANCLLKIDDLTSINDTSTNALPGESWHQFGLAVDCAWLIGDKLCWDNKFLFNGINGYEILANEAERLNICSGHSWTTLKDSCHLQANFATPSQMFSWKEINNTMEKRFGHLLKI